MQDKAKNSQIITHFRMVLSYLSWSIVESEIRIMTSNSHVLIKFSYNEKMYIYRHANFSSFQINRQVIAFDLLKKLTPQIFYFDELCLIESFIEGNVLELNTKDSNWEKVGRLLSDVHTNKGCGFGEFVTTKSTTCTSFSELIKSYLKSLVFIEKLGILSKEELINLEKYLLSPPPSADPVPRVCHGDFWFKNIIQNNKTAEISLIDWEGLLSCYREYDFVQFSRLDDSGAASRIKLIKSAYKFNLNQKLINYFIVTRTVNRYRHFHENKEKVELMNKKLLSYKKYFN